MITRRVSAGSMMSSTIAHDAAMKGSMVWRTAAAYSARAADGSSDAAICLVKMMSTAPSGPMTEISAVGHATNVSGS